MADRNKILLVLAQADGQTWGSIAEASPHTAEVMYGKQADAMESLITARLRVQAEQIATAITAAKPKHFTRDYTHVDGAYDNAARIARDHAPKED